MDQAALMQIVRSRLGKDADNYLIPPPVFEAMRGQLLAFDAKAGSLTARFPVLAQHLNPYGSMQGGMVAAAVDNTLGPLSMLVAPPNVTRRLHMKYSRPVTPECDHIIVRARLLECEGRRLSFSAEVRDPSGVLLARAQADHWIVDDPGSQYPAAHASVRPPEPSAKIEVL